MSSISYRVKGSWQNTINWLTRNLSLEDSLTGILNEGGRVGVMALENATPVDTGLAANSWGYKVLRGKGFLKIEWHNYDIEGGYNVAVLVRYGHGTKQGVYIPPNDFITPALEPVFQAIGDRVWQEVTR